MRKYNDRTGEISFLSNIVKGECSQVTPSGVVTTKGFKSTTPYLDSPNGKDTRYHYPFYGRVNEK